MASHLASRLILNNIVQTFQFLVTRMAPKKKNNASGGKNEIPSWDWFWAFFFFLVLRQCSLVVGSTLHVVSCDTELCDSRQGKAIPLKDVTAKSVAGALLSVIPTWGPPVELLSNQGPEFVAELNCKLSRQQGIKRQYAMAYHPKTNRQVEPFNRTLKAMIKNMGSWQPSHAAKARAGQRSSQRSGWVPTPSLRYAALKWWFSRS